MCLQLAPADSSRPPGISCLSSHLPLRTIYRLQQKYPFCSRPFNMLYKRTVLGIQTMPDILTKKQYQKPQSALVWIA